MAPKDSTVRITDTLNFIQNSNVLTAGERNSAHALAQNFINNRYPAGNAGQQAYETFSGNMSLGWHLRGDPNSIRNMKRAAYLLFRAIEDTVGNNAAPGTYGNYQNAAQISDGRAPGVFTGMVRRAALIQDAANGNNNAANRAQQDLLLNPLQFLRDYMVIVLGSPNRDLTQGDRNVLAFNFGFDSSNNRLVFRVPAMPGAVILNVDSVTAMNWTSVPGSYVNGNPAGGNFSQIPAIELASNFMVTTQFTGCAFCMKHTNGNMYCAHVAPRRDDGTQAHAPLLSGTQVAQRIFSNGGVAGNFSNAAGGGPLSIYGSAFSSSAPPGAGNGGGYPNNLGGGHSYMTIVGVLRAPNYEICAQVTQNSQITRAERIF